MDSSLTTKLAKELTNSFTFGSKMLLCKVTCGFDVPLAGILVACREADLGKVNVCPGMATLIGQLRTGRKSFLGAGFRQISLTIAAIGAAEQRKIFSQPFMLLVLSHLPNPFAEM